MRSVARKEERFIAQYLDGPRKGISGTEYMTGRRDTCTRISVEYGVPSRMSRMLVKNAGQ